MGSGKGVSKRTKNRTQVQAVEEILLVERNYCLRGRDLRDLKFYYSAPGYNDLLGFNDELEANNENEEKFNLINKQYKDHLLECPTCHLADTQQKSAQSAYFGGIL